MSWTEGARTNADTNADIDSHVDTASRPTPPVPEAFRIALADILVTTDELDHERDRNGGRPGAREHHVRVTNLGSPSAQLR
eukprot:1184222-Pleurochrysis_carterae.AAC.1